MRKIFTLLFVCSLLTGVKSYAQSFAMQHDTVTVTAGSTIQNIVDGVNNLLTTDITVSWKVISTNFPADWITPTGICDNKLCYTASSLWPSGTVNNSNPYATGLGDFHMQIDLSGAATMGCYYMKVRLNNQAVPTDTAIVTFIVCKVPAAVPNVKPSEEISLYPNPASSELNVIYDASADIKNIAVYNIIGKLMTVYKVTGNNSANLNLENIPSGIYFVRLINAHGAIAATRKFTKQ